jgi:predicted RND superfamily exporter protein
MENTSPEPAPKKDSNKIYFLIVVIAALLGTNVYMALRDKKANERIVTITDEKSRMEVEIDKIEAELDKANNSNLQLTASMQEEQDLARQKISELRDQLQKGKLTQGQLAKAKEDVRQLKYFVSKYTADIDDLKKQNKALSVERDSLKNTVGQVTAKAADLETKNLELNTKVVQGAALKVANLAVTPLKVKSSGKESDVTRASSAKKFRVTFTAAENPIAATGMHDIYMRIVDPSGNLIVADNGSLFTSDGEELQYTYKTAIEYANDGKVYNIDWTNPSEFQKGTYTIVLYADGFTMGKTSITLR